MRENLQVPDFSKQRGGKNGHIIGRPSIAVDFRPASPTAYLVPTPPVRCYLTQYVLRGTGEPAVRDDLQGCGGRVGQRGAMRSTGLSRCSAAVRLVLEETSVFTGGSYAKAARTEMRNANG